MEAAPKRNLTPAFPKEIFSAEGGRYQVWLSSDVTMLSEARIGAAKQLEINVKCQLFVLEPHAHLPRRQPWMENIYVGSGIFGIVLPEEPERVLKAKRGDTIALPMGAVSWWFNDNPSEELEVLFLGDTSKGHKSGEFTDFHLVGASNGLYHGFSKKIMCRAWDLKENELDHIISSQSGSGIVKLEEGTRMPTPETEAGDKLRLVFNCEEATLDIHIEDGGSVVVLTPNKLPLLKEIELGADLVKIDKAVKGSCHDQSIDISVHGCLKGSNVFPGYSSDSAFQVTYITKGSGRVEVVGVDGKRALEFDLQPGYLFIVPRFYVVSKIAGDEGMQWFSIITKPNPVFTNHAGKTGVFKALSKETFAATFNVDEKTEALFHSKRTQDAVFFPPPKN